MQKQRVYLVNSAIDTTCTNHNFCLARFCFVLVFFFNFNFVLIFFFLFSSFYIFFGHFLFCDTICNVYYTIYRQL